MPSVNSTIRRGPAATIPQAVERWIVDTIDRSTEPLVHYFCGVHRKEREPHFASVRRKVGTDWLPAVAAGAITVNAEGEVLLHRRRDDGTWSIPGGGVEIGERVDDAVCREVQEETGYDVRCVRLVAIRSGRDCTVTYLDGNKYWFLGFLYLVEICGGEPSDNTEETTGLGWFRPDGMPAAISPFNAWCVRQASRSSESIVVD